WGIKGPPVPDVDGTHPPTFFQERTGAARPVVLLRFAFPRLAGARRALSLCRRAEKRVCARRLSLAARRDRADRFLQRGRQLLLDAGAARGGQRRAARQDARAFAERAALRSGRSRGGAAAP